MMKIRVKKLSPEAKLPSKAHPDEDAGFDLYCTESAWLAAERGVEEVPTGISVEIPKGYYGQIMTRSSFGKKGMRVHPGVVDSGYRGEITIFVYNFASCQYKIEAGDKIAQLLILPVPEVEIEEVEGLSSSNRGEKGFGSTGR
jgi:dUTP pyrophosphatase